MPRTPDEWIGATDDAAIPDRVKLRVLLAHDGRCALSGHKFRPGDVIEYDHKVALALGGRHAEANLQPVLGAKHKLKTAQDVATLAKDRRVRAKHLGLVSPSKRRLPGGRGDRLKKRVDGSTVRRFAD